MEQGSGEGDIAPVREPADDTTPPPIGLQHSTSRADIVRDEHPNSPPPACRTGVWGYAVDTLILCPGTAAHASQGAGVTG